jgi:rare lipoprotein A
MDLMSVRHLAASVLMLMLTWSAVCAEESAEAPPSSTGLASYYGPGFHGGVTASGEVFNQYELVAAHRTLPFGSIVRVTNLKNGRSVILRVIDRGPFGRNHRKGCIIDVSRGAARRLQFVRDGITRVRVQVLQ